MQQSVSPSVAVGGHHFDVFVGPVFALADEAAEGGEGDGVSLHRHLVRAAAVRPQQQPVADDVAGEPTLRPRHGRRLYGQTRVVIRTIKSEGVSFLVIFLNFILRSYYYNMRVRFYCLPICVVLLY